jgi:DNA gyrase subunit B
LQQRLNADDSRAVFKLELDYKDARLYDYGGQTLHGNSKIFVCMPSFFNSLDYKKIAEYANKTNGLFTETAVMRMGERDSTAYLQTGV